MRLETPVLEREPAGQWYKVGCDAWVCRPELSKFFQSTPVKISLSAATRPSKQAVKVERIRSGCVTIDEVDVKLCTSLWELAEQFSDAGHKMIYVTLWEHK